LTVIQQIERSILYSGKYEKLLSMVKYNLSRYNDNKSFLGDAVKNLSSYLNNKNDRDFLFRSVHKYFSGEQNADADKNSKVLDALCKILDKQIENENIKLLKSESLQSVVHSLLSSPSNFTPLLHFIIPVTEPDTDSFAEMWINPNEENDASESNDSSRTIHMLIVFDINNLGRFETELYVIDKEIKMTLLCPPEYTDYIKDISDNFYRCIDFSDYSFKEVKIDKLERPRSLIEVFRDLPGKRLGINVKI
jgi:hypothetical protein